MFQRLDGSQFSKCLRRQLVAFEFLQQALQPASHLQRFGVLQRAAQRRFRSWTELSQFAARRVAPGKDFPVEIDQQLSEVLWVHSPGRTEASLEKGDALFWSADQRGDGFTGSTGVISRQIGPP
jgi:hypothetical protein